MANLQQLEKEIEKIKDRNEKVESDKKWETSNSRRALIAIFTYAAIALYLQAIGIQNAFLHAIVPTIGFLLSVLTLPFFKEIWLKKFYKK